MEGSNDNNAGSRWQRWRESLRNTYRLMIMNEETFEEVRSLKLSLLNVYLAVSSIIVVVALLVVLVVAYTPVKKYLPGFGDAVQRDELVRLNRQVDALAEELEAQRAYADNFRRILVGDYETAEEVEAASSAQLAEAVDSMEEVPLSAEEVQLRREVELASIGDQGAGGNSRLNAGSNDVPLEQLFFVAPVRGEISAGYKPDEGHRGVDILGSKGTAIKACLDGFVILSDYTYETGHTIGIQHGNNIITFYKHNSELLKRVGDFVQAGEAVAIIGNTGTLSSGPHLHFELWHKGMTVDPTQYVKF